MTDFSRLSEIQQGLSSLNELHPWNDTSLPPIGELYKHLNSLHVYQNRLKFLSTWKSEEYVIEWANTKFLKSNYSTNRSFHGAKALTAIRIISFLEELLPNCLTHENHLDICGGNGCISKVFQALRFTKHSDSIDILDRRAEFPFNVYETKDFIKEILTDKRYVLNDNYIQGKSSAELFDQICFSSTVPDLLFHNTDSTIEEPQLYVDDFLDHDFKGKQYDLITLFSGMEYFDLVPCFEKVQSVLNKGGVLFMLTSNYFHRQGYTMVLPCIYPWLHLLFSKDELASHLLSLYDSSISQAYLSAHYFNHDLVTCSGISAVAEQFGLKNIGIKRIMGIDPVYLEKNHDITKEQFCRDDYLLQSCLYDFIRRIKPEYLVSPSDFNCHTHVLVFRK